MIEKLFVYMVKVVYELPNTRLVCKFDNADSSVFFYKTLSILRV